MKNPVMVAAGQKAGITRRLNQVPRDKSRLESLEIAYADEMKRLDEQYGSVSNKKHCSTLPCYDLDGNDTTVAKFLKRYHKRPLSTRHTNLVFELTVNTEVLRRTEHSLMQKIDSLSVL